VFGPVGLAVTSVPKVPFWKIIDVNALHLTSGMPPGGFNYPQLVGQPRRESLAALSSSLRRQRGWSMDGAVKIITGRERRRRWSLHDKVSLVAETNGPGLQSAKDPIIALFLARPRKALAHKSRSRIRHWNNQG
jgi:hypothetical protein